MQGNITSSERGGHANTAQAILDSATVLMQRGGYHAFSYADVSEQIGIRKASIHYHFPAKKDLACGVVARYRQEARAALQYLQQHFNPLQQLEQYVAFYGEQFQGNPRMCLCALLAAEMLTLPDEVRAEVQQFYQEHIAWLGQLLIEGARQGLLRFEGDASTEAQVLLAGLEGAMLSARAFGDTARFRTIADGLLLRYRVPS